MFIIWLTVAGAGFRERTGRHHREEVVESTTSLPLQTVGTKWELTEAGKEQETKGLKEGNHMHFQHVYLVFYLNQS